MTCPKWTEGWLARFKKRHWLKERRRHGEAGSAELTEECFATMEETRKACEEYSANNTYNMDKTGLFWKLSLIEASRSLNLVERNQTRLKLQPLYAVTPQAETGFHYKALSEFSLCN
jgi:hypothetical protein